MSKDRTLGSPVDREEVLETLVKAACQGSTHLTLLAFLQAVREREAQGPPSLMRGAFLMPNRSLAISDCPGPDKMGITDVTTEKRWNISF